MKEFKLFIATFISCYLFLLTCVASQTLEIDTVAGLRFYDGEGGFASHVAVNRPYHVAFHPVTEDVFIADTLNHVIRKIDQVSGRITTVAGIPGREGYSGDGGLATQATLLRPESIAFLMVLMVN